MAKERERKVGNNKFVVADMKQGICESCLLNSFNVYRQYQRLQFASLVEEEAVKC